MSDLNQPPNSKIPSETKTQNPSENLLEIDSLGSPESEKPMTSQQFSSIEIIPQELQKLVIEIRELRNILEDFRTGRVSLDNISPSIKISCHRINEIIDRIDYPTDEHILAIKILWGQIKDYPLLCKPECLEQNVQILLQWVDIIDTQLERIAYRSGFWTIPHRIDEWLEKAKPGSVLPFRVIFEDELIYEEYQQNILDHTICTPKILKNNLKGMIDVHKRLIYRSSRSLTIVFRALLIALVLCVESAIIYALPYSALLDIKSNHNLYLGWGAALLGAFVYHIFQSLQRAADEIGISVLPFTRAYLTIGARTQMFILLSFALFIGYVGFLYSFGVPSDGEARDYFLISSFLTGYGIDSISNTIGATLDEKASEQQTRMKKRFERS